MKLNKEKNSGWKYFKARYLNFAHCQLFGFDLLAGFEDRCSNYIVVVGVAAGPVGIHFIPYRRSDNIISLMKIVCESFRIDAQDSRHQY